MIHQARLMKIRLRYRQLLFTAVPALVAQVRFYTVFVFMEIGVNWLTATKLSIGWLKIHGNILESSLLICLDVALGRRTPRKTKICIQKFNL